MDIGFIFLTILLAVPLTILISFFSLVIMASQTRSNIETRTQSHKRAEHPQEAQMETGKHFHADKQSDKGTVPMEFEKGEEYAPEASSKTAGKSEGATIGFVPYQERIGAAEEAALHMRSQYAASKDEGSHVPQAKIAQQPRVTLPMESASTRYEVSTDFFKVLCRLKSESFAVGGKPSETPIWICNRDDKVVDVLLGFIQRNILSVPVLQQKTGKYYGFLDFMTIAKYIVEHFGEKHFQVERSFWDLVSEEKVFARRTVGDLITQYHDTATTPIYYPIKAGYSAMCVLETLAREKGLRRVPIINNENDQQLSNLVTQSQCVRWIASNIGLLGEKRNKLISSCPHFLKPVHAVTENTVAYEAFKEMVDRNISGLAIVDSDTNRLKGNVSIRDLKLIGADASLFWRLHQTMKNFIIKLRHEFETRHHRPVRVVYILKESTIGDVIQLLVHHDIHRVYIVDSHQHRKPIGLVSLRDILLECLE